MTEDQAKTKWCPFARTLEWESPTALGDSDFIFGATNRAHDQGRSRCIGSACMAWREHHVWRNYYKKSGEPVKLGDTYTLAQVEERREPMNFCGLAGAPE